MQEREVHFCHTSDGVRIAYIDVGDPSGLPIVMLQGPASHVARISVLPLNIEAIEAVTSAGGRVIWYDGRGMGNSQRDVGEMSFETQVRDLEAVVDHLELRRFVLESAGFGQPALAYAARHPERVLRLVLWRAFADGAAWFRQNPIWNGLRSMSDSDDLWETYTLVAANVLSGFQNAPEAAEWAAITREATTPAVYRAYLDAVRKTDVTSVLGQIRAPTLLLWSPLDGSPVELVRDVAAKVPGARMVTIPGGTGSPEAFRIVGEFIRTPSAPLEVAPMDASADLADDRAAFAETALRVILFTDLVGHTAMMRRLGDAKGRDVLREHERITRDLLDRYGGTEIKTIGDSFMTSFTSAARAVECAISLQRVFEARNATAEEQLKVRVGLNVGEPIEEEDDLFGESVILASRIKEHAGAEEILMPEALRHLLAGKGFLFADHGDFMPKGFEESVRLCEVRWRG